MSSEIKQQIINDTKVYVSKLLESAISDSKAFDRIAKIIAAAGATCTTIDEMQDREYTKLAVNLFNENVVKILKGDK